MCFFAVSGVVDKVSVDCFYVHSCLLFIKRLVSASILDASTCHDDCYLFDINLL